MTLRERVSSPLREVRSAAPLVGLVAIAAYVNALWNGFAFDDLLIIVNNPAAKDLDSLGTALSSAYWPGPYGRELGLWRPLTSGTYNLLYALGGGSALPFHVANVLGHAAVSMLVVLLCASLMPVAAALTAGLVFAVHPVHVEAVSNIVGYAEISSALAVLGACAAHLRRPERAGWRHALLLGALYLVAFGAKESGAVLPALILLVDAARSELGLRDIAPYLRGRWRDYAVMAVVGVAMLAGRYALLGSLASALPPFGADLLTEIPRIWTLGEAWSHYVRLWVFPLDLYGDYSPNVVPISFGWRTENTVGVVVALGILAAALVAARRLPLGPSASRAGTFAFGIGWFVLAILPTANFFFLSGVILAERTLYLPSVGLAAATGWIVFHAAGTRPRAIPALFVVALALLSVRTWTRTPVWRSNDTFFQTLLRDAPHAGRSQWILGDSFLMAGNTSQALLAYRLAINLLDGHYQLITEIAQRLMEMERWETAERLYMRAFRDRPEIAIAPAQIAWIRAQYGDVEGVEEYARLSLERIDEDAARHHLLAWALAAQGEWEEAAEERRRAEELRTPVVFWHIWMYEAYVRRHEGDTLGAHMALDSAWASAATGRGRQTMDSVRVADFGLEPLTGAGAGGSGGL